MSFLRNGMMADDALNYCEASAVVLRMMCSSTADGLQEYCNWFALLRETTACFARDKSAYAKNWVFRGDFFSGRPLNPLWTPYWTPYFGAFPRFLLIKSHFRRMILWRLTDDVLLLMGGRVASNGWKHRFQSLETRLPMGGSFGDPPQPLPIGDLCHDSAVSKWT